MHDTNVHGVADVHVGGVSSIHLDQIEAHQCQRCNVVDGEASNVEGIAQEQTGPAEVVLAQVRLRLRASGWCGQGLGCNSEGCVVKGKMPAVVAGNSVRFGFHGRQARNG